MKTKCQIVHSHEKNLLITFHLKGFQYLPICRLPGSSTLSAKAFNSTTSVQLPNDTHRSWSSLARFDKGSYLYNYHTNLTIVNLHHLVFSGFDFVRFNKSTKMC